MNSGIFEVQRIGDADIFFAIKDFEIGSGKDPYTIEIKFKYAGDEEAAKKYLAEKVAQLLGSFTGQFK